MGQGMLPSSCAQHGLTARRQQRCMISPCLQKYCSPHHRTQKRQRRAITCSSSSTGLRTDKILLWDIMVIFLLGQDTVVRDPFYEEVPTFFNMSLKQLYSVKHPTAWVEFERGEISEEALVSRFFRDGRAFDSEGMKRMMLEACEYMDGIQQLLEELLDEGIHMHAMSNYPVWYQDINAKLRIDRYLQGWTFMSCEGPMKGLRKPDPRCWKVAQSHLGAELSQLVLIDDRMENCDSAREAGLHAIHSRDADSTRKELVELSIL